jgi:hypothetical protein
MLRHREQRAALLLVAWSHLFGTVWVTAAADLQAKTVTAFDRYVRVTEARIEAEVRDNQRFLWVHTLPERDRQVREDALRAGAVVVERMSTTDNGKSIEVPDGLIHHWIGVAFLPKVGLEAVLALLQDYDRHGEVYRPRIERSKLRVRDGDMFRFYLRFFMKKVITVVIESEHEARFTRPAPDRAYSRIVSTRMAEVENPGTPQEKEKPVGHDGGYLWRLNTYWRFLEKEGGTYVQCESLSLTRGIPLGLGWMIGPFVNSLPRESLEFTMATTRTVLASVK